MIDTVGEITDELLREVQGVLGETLALGSRAFELRLDSPLLGVLPELDSMAVLTVLLGLEESFGITVEDDDVDADTFETLETLARLVAQKLATD